MIEVWTRAELGMSRRALDVALAAGVVLRARRDHYLRGDAPPALIEAVRIGGRLTCLSLLQLLGVFVFANTATHVHIARGSSRLRSPTHRGRRLPARQRRDARLHWRPLWRADESTAGRTGVIDAVIHAVRCQAPRYAIATIDSALNQGVIRAVDLIDVFAALEARYQALRPLIDGRAQSGPETLMRLMARAMGFSIELQRRFDHVGYVDLVLDGWLVVECDSKEFHSTWAQQMKDRARDLALAQQGFVTLRLTAAEILYRPEAVQEALRALSRHPRRQAPAQ